MFHFTVLVILCCNENVQYTGTTRTNFWIYDRYFNNDVNILRILIFISQKTSNDNIEFKHLQHQKALLAQKKNQNFLFPTVFAMHTMFSLRDT